MTEIYMTVDHQMLVSGYGNPAYHVHAASHILISLQDKFVCDASGTEYVCRGIMLPGGIPHTVKNDGQPMLVFLLDSSQTVGSRITSITKIPDSIVELIETEYEMLNNADKKQSAYPLFYHHVMKELGFTNIAVSEKDSRIVEAIHYIEKHLGENLTIKEVAEALYLSESWFSHLFREQMGISFAGYLVIKRIYAVYMGIVNGKNITEASLEAGFSSSAHFAAANKKMFGITARELSGDYVLYNTTDI